MYVGSLKSDHGEYLTAENGGGDEGQRDGERPKGLAVANRSTPGNGDGDWQRIKIVPSDESGFVGLMVETDQTNGPRYACAENAGQDGIVVFNRPALGDWEKWRLWTSTDGKVSFESKMRAGFFIKAWPGGDVSLSQPMVDQQPVAEPGGYESFTPEPPMGSVVVGPVGVDRLHLPIIATPRGWGDQTGIRPLLFASWFPLIRILKDDPDRYERTLDMLQSWGVVGIRGFIDVRHPSYWQGREVKHEWPEFNALVEYVAESLLARGMGWFITAGDLQLTNGYEAYKKAAATLASFRKVLAVVDVNEAWQNTEAGLPDNPKHCADLVEPFAKLGVPWATSAHSSSDSDHEGLLRMVDWNDSKGRKASVATVHGPGGTTHMVRHIFNHRYETFGFDVALMQGEPRGPGQDVSAGRVDHPSWVVLAATAACMTGQLYVLHCSRGVRDRDDDDPWYAFAPYFLRAAALLKRIPRSRVRALGHGGKGGSNPEAVFASTRPDGAFHEDKPGITGQFHRCDVATYDSGERAVLLYGGNGERSVKVVRTVSGTFFNTHGEAVRQGGYVQGTTITFSEDEAGDGLLFVGR